MKKRKQGDQKKLAEIQSVSGRTRPNKSIKGRKIEINEFLCSNSQQSLNSLNFPIELSEDLRKKKSKKITFDKNKFNDECIESINIQIKRNFGKKNFNKKQDKPKKKIIQKVKSPEKKITRKTSRKTRPKKSYSKIRLTAQTLKSIKDSLGKSFRDKQIVNKLDEIIKLVKNKHKSQQEIGTVKGFKENQTMIKRNFEVDEKFQKVLQKMKKIKDFQKQKSAQKIHIDSNGNEIKQLIKSESQNNKEFINSQFKKFQERQRLLHMKEIMIKKQSILEQQNLLKEANKQSQEILDEKLNKINQFYENQLINLKKQQEELKIFFETKIDNIKQLFVKRNKSFVQQRVSNLQWSFQKQKPQFEYETNYKFKYFQNNTDQKQLISDPSVYFQKKKSIENINKHNLNNDIMIQNNLIQNQDQKKDTFDNFYQTNQNQQKFLICQKTTCQQIFDFSDNLIEEAIEESLKEYIKQLLDSQKVQIKQQSQKYLLVPDTIRQYLYLLFEQITDQLAIILIKNLNRNYGINLMEQIQILKSDDFIDNSITTEALERAVIPIQQIKIFQKNISYQNHYEQNSQNLICDCLQEILCSWRRYSLFGEPMNWRIRLGQCYQPVIEITKLISILEISLEKIIEWQSLRCGTMLTSLKFEQYSQVSFDFEEEREQKLQKYLQWEILESDDQWIDYEKAQIQTIFFIENQIFNDIIEDLAYFLSNNQIFQQWILKQRRKEIQQQTNLNPTTFKN